MSLEQRFVWSNVNESVILAEDINTISLWDQSIFNSFLKIVLFCFVTLQYMDVQQSVF